MNLANKIWINSELAKIYFQTDSRKTDIEYIRTEWLVEQINKEMDGGKGDLFVISSIRKTALQEVLSIIEGTSRQTLPSSL